MLNPTPKKKLMILANRLETYVRRLTHSHEDVSGVPPTIDCASHQDFLKLCEQNSLEQARIFDIESSLIQEKEQFGVRGHCVVCNMRMTFKVDYQYSYAMWNGKPVPNWRERLVCQECGLNNRMRAAFGFLKTIARPADAIYLTEQITLLFPAVARLFPNTVGSEFLRDGTPRGMMNAAGIRHEDATCLTFQDASFDCIGTFDVLEHVPDYRRALAEFHRCLRPGGMLLMTVPFDVHAPATLIRAVVEKDGSIRHLHPPEYHGDPLSKDGVLCFHNFGWSFLDDMKQVGFKDACLSFYWSRQLGYLGGYQFVIKASTPARAAEA